MFSEIIKKYDIVTLKDSGFLRGDWFIGSALMAHDYESLKEGIYFYPQETIWTRILDLEYINPYWEIYNQTYNFLLVNKQDSLAMNFLTSLLREIEVISSKTLDFVVITSNEHLIRNLIDRDYYIITKEIPFFIENSKVGNYFKIFVKNGGQFIPIIDCTEFKIQSKKYFEININKFYLKLLDYFLHGEIPEKFKFFGNTSNFNIESLFLKFIDSQENIRVVSLLDCLIQLSSKNIEISGNYKGHTVKKILKKFALYSVITKLDITKVNHLLRNDYIYFLMKEIDNITKKYPKLIQKYPRDILSDRYGITNEVYRYLIGENLHIKINHKLDEVRYFTDIPFIDTSLSIEEFDKIVSKILKIKVGG